MTWKIATSALFMTASLAGAAEPALPLWPGIAPGSENALKPELVVTNANGERAVSQIATPTLTPFYADHPNGTAIIVSPGSGFRAEVFDAEGVAVARWLTTLGVDAYVLKYRLPSEGHTNGEDVIVQDIQRAIRLVRTQTAHKARRVGTLGFSAGGNLTAISAVYYDRQVYTPVDASDALSARPDFFAVVYGYVPRQEDLGLVHTPPDSPTVRYLAKYPFEPAVTADTPPCFVVHGDSDRHVSAEHGIRIATAVAKAGGRCEFHLIKGADHGFGLHAIGEDRIWPTLFASWLAKQN
ncbi:alpha/beta hydrolase [Rhizomicrobium electricum]|uniref:Alpha/beta hydrolase n=1 Tax=Rhizomicrobium electricum TaxID=480070 RepID=A0ABN1F9E9_9PROT|nr:alpha/beta hydrolase [Rhizomicrobium electricum]NIJ46810.1 acetyl esterase/lipase [Rhizomicrobium electricum]